MERQRARKRKKKKSKIFPYVMLFLVVAAVSFAVAIKLFNPDMKLFSRESDENVKSPSVVATEATTGDYTYIPIEEFSNDTERQGNRVGNLLSQAGGRVVNDGTTIFVSVEGEGIFTLNPVTETGSTVSFTASIPSSDFKNLNAIDGYIYFTDSLTSVLYRAKSDSSEAEKVADDIGFCYVYDKTIYFVSADKAQIGIISVDDLSKKVLYRAESSSALCFCGISSSRVFFTSTDVSGIVEYLTVNVTDSNDLGIFREKSNPYEIMNLQLEAGFMYFCRASASGGYELCRQKIGSANVVSLADGVSPEYAVISKDRCYYSYFDSNSLIVRELNMNSSSKKTMLRVDNADVNTSMQYASTYIIAIGNLNTSQKICRATSIYTASNVVMGYNFDEKCWKY